MRDIDWMSEAVGHEVQRPEDIYESQVEASLHAAEELLAVSIARG